jgi:protocatechuate 3,4-dioxygenase alpha subunit
MTASAKLIPTSSQTVGPYFSIGLQDLIDRTPELQEGSRECISIHGQVLDGDGAAVPDAVLEFWSAAEPAPETPANPNQGGYPLGFRRAATDVEGNFSVVIQRPAPTVLADGRMQAPYLLVLVFARGLLRNLISRVYFANDPGNALDPLLHELPAERRGTLIAHSDGNGATSYGWNIILKGRDETVFFVW